MSRDLKEAPKSPLLIPYIHSLQACGLNEGVSIKDRVDAYLPLAPRHYSYGSFPPLPFSFIEIDFSLLEGIILFISIDLFSLFLFSPGLVFMSPKYARG